jgi:hypothetical protein
MRHAFGIMGVNLARKGPLEITGLVRYEDYKRHTA